MFCFRTTRCFHHPPHAEWNPGTLVSKHRANQGTPSIKMSAEPHWLPKITLGPSYALGTRAGVSLRISIGPFMPELQCSHAPHGRTCYLSRLPTCCECSFTLLLPSGFSHSNLRNCLYKGGSQDLSRDAPDFSSKMTRRRMGILRRFAPQLEKTTYPSLLLHG